MDILSELALVSVILFKIMCVESSGKPVKLHPDGSSYGYFGLTETACKEVGADFPPKSPLEEMETAEKYLRLMRERHNCDWLDALGWYHGGDKERRQAYIEKAMKVKPEDYPEAVEMWHKITEDINEEI